MVAVGDQELPIREGVGESILGKPPETRAFDLDVRLSPWAGGGRLALVEEEEWLELRPGLPEQAQAAFLRAAVGALVREDDPVLVRLRSERGHQALARAGDAVGADVVLREPPVARLRLVREHAVAAPLTPEPARAGLVLGERQVDDVVGVFRREPLALLG